MNDRERLVEILWQGPGRIYRGDALKHADNILAAGYRSYTDEATVIVPTTLLLKVLATAMKNNHYTQNDYPDTLIDVFERERADIRTLREFTQLAIPVEVPEDV